MVGILEAIKKGFGLATKNIMLVAILFAFNLIGSLTSMPFAAPATAEAGAAAPQLPVAAVIFSIVFILISIFFQGATIGLVRDAIKAGKMQLSNFVSYGMKYYLRLLVLGILIILIVAVVALVIGLIIAMVVPLNNTVVTAIAVTIAVAIGIITALLYFIPLTLSPYALVCDEVGAIEAMKRSLAVAKKPFARVLWLLLLFVLLILISLGIGFAVGLVVGLITAVLPAGLGRILMSVVTSAINGYLGVVMMAAFMIFYLSIAGKEKPVVAGKTI
ncbi:MAG: hypothetical protein WC592_07055 [Candidatus Omnitrophota bacterium]|nr:hypothetical protein [Candidatus Omnitrophota bacterium]